MKKSTLALFISFALSSSAIAELNGPAFYPNNQVWLDVQQANTTAEVANDGQKRANKRLDEIDVDVSEAKQNAKEANEKVTVIEGTVNDLTGRVETNEKNISKLGDSIIEQTKRGELAYDELNEKKLDKTDFESQVSRGENAYNLINNKVDGAIIDGTAEFSKVNNSISNIEGDVTILNGKVTKVENAGTSLIANKDVIINKGNSIIDGAKGDIINQINNNIEAAIGNVIIGNNPELNAKWELAKAAANDYDTRITANTNEIIRLDRQKADRTELVNLEQKGNDAFNSLDSKIDVVNNNITDLNSKVDTNIELGSNVINRIDNSITDIQGDVANINNQIDFVQNNKDVAIKAGKTYVDNTVNEGIDIAISHGKATITNKWEENKGDIVANVNGKVENITKNITEEITNEVINNIGDIVIDGSNETVVNIKNEITNEVKHDLTLSAKNIGLHIRKEIQEGNNEIYNNVKGSIVAKAQDFQEQIDAINETVDSQIALGKETYVEDRRKIIGAFGYLEDHKLDKTDFDTQVQRGENAYANLKIEGNEALNNINNQFIDVNNSITNLEANINNGIADNRDELIAMGKNESVRLENDLRNDGKAAYDDLAARIEKATSEEEINNILNQYKKDQFAKIQARVNAARPGAEQALANAKDKAKNEANLYVKGKIDQAIADNSDAGKDYVKNEIDKAVEGLVPGTNDLNDRIEKIENTLDKGKDIAMVAKDQGKATAIKLAAKSPVVKGAIGDKVNAAKTINAKADAALAMGNDNSVAIITERNDRIQGQRDTLKAANSYTDSRFNSMQKQVDDNRKRAAAGISGVSAMTNIPQLSGNSNYSFGVGIGGFDSEQSIAAGMSGRISESVILRSSLSTSTQGEVVWGAGVGFEW